MPGCVPQESIIGPTVFLIFFTELEMSMCSLCRQLADCGEIAGLCLKDDSVAVNACSLEWNLPLNSAEFQRLASEGKLSDEVGVIMELIVPAVWM